MKEWRFQLSNGSRVTLTPDAVGALREYFLSSSDRANPVTRMEFYSDDHSYVGSIFTTGQVSHRLEGGYAREVISQGSRVKTKILPEGKKVPTAVWERVPCPACKVEAGTRCRSIHGKRKTTDTHRARFELSPIFDDEEFCRTFRAR